MKYETEAVPKIINNLNSILSSPIASQRILVVAIFAEVRKKCECGLVVDGFMDE